MFLEILQPHGDPFAEPQVMLMNHLVEAGVLGELADKLDARLSVLKLVIGNPEAVGPAGSTENPHEQREAEIARIERFLNRFLLLWNILMKHCADLFPQHYPAGRLVTLAEGCIEQVDPGCKNKKLQMEYVKFLRKLLTQSDESVAQVLVKSSHFITVIKKVNRKNNMLSSQVRAVFEEMKKLQWFKLHQQFVETYKDTLEDLKRHNLAIETLVNHNKRMRHNMRASSHVDEEKVSERQSEKKSVGADFIELNGLNSPISGDAKSSSALGEIDPLPTPQLENLFKKFRSSKNSDDDDDDEKDNHDIFPGLGFKGNGHSPTTQQIVPEPDIEIKSAKSEGDTSAKFEICFDLGKRDGSENGDEEEPTENGEFPTKRFSM